MSFSIRVFYCGYIILLICISLTLASTSVQVVDRGRNITYLGSSEHGVESFSSIRYGKDTGGEWRFQPPRPYMYPASTVVNSTTAGPACPQRTDQNLDGIPTNGGIGEISEDCLNLRIARPVGTTSADSLPVMVWIYGGGDEYGSIDDPLYNPQGLISNAASQGFPVIFVAMNYRVNVFGFANSATLLRENSLNAGLRDQRLALEWIQDNIGLFGGDASSVTLFGQSDGGTGVGLQLSAYGGHGKAPFSGAILESGSGSADPGVSGNFTRYSTSFVAEQAGCTGSDDAVLACLRRVPMHKLLDAVKAYENNQSSNPQDIFFPAVDGTFIPAAPSILLREGRFYKGIPVIAGWAYNDGSIFTPTSITTELAAVEFIKFSFPHITSKTLKHLLKLYPAADFAGPATSLNVSAQYLRAAEIYRDLDYACPALYSAQQVAAYGSASYVYEFNVTAFALFEEEYNVEYLGVFHTSEIPFVFNDVELISNKTTYQRDAEKVSGSWAHFATSGTPVGNSTLQNWPLFVGNRGQVRQIRVIGGPGAHVHEFDGSALAERCAFVNSAAFYAELQT